MAISQKKSSPFVSVFEAIDLGEKKLKISGLAGSSQAYLLAELAKAGHPFCLVAPSFEQAEDLMREIRFFLEIGKQYTEETEDSDPDKTQTVIQPEILFFPPWDILPYESAVPRPDRIAERLSTLHRLAKGGQLEKADAEEDIDRDMNTPSDSVMTSVITTIDTFLQKVVSKRFLLDRSLSLRIGETRSREDLINQLYERGYEVETVVSGPGEIAVRGGIIDLFPPAMSGPVRIEFFGDEIESIRTFDLETQRSLKELEQLEIILGHEDLCDPNFYRVPFSDYLDKKMLLIRHEPEALFSSGKRYLEEVKEASFFALKRDKELPKSDTLFLPLSHLEDVAFHRSTIDIEGLVLRPEKGVRRLTFETRSPAVLGFERPEQSFEEISAHLETLRQDHLVILAVKNQHQLERFEHLLSDHDVPWGNLSKIQGVWPTPPAPVLLCTGHLSRGFSLGHSDLLFLTDDALMGGRKGTSHAATRTKPGKSGDKLKGFLASFEDLKPRDYVVHIDHGIGRYVGLKRLSIREGERTASYETDFMVLEYAGGDKVYVPLESFSLVQRYVGAEGASPKCDKLGGIRWSKAKAKVKGEIKKMTGELLELYAQRELARGQALEISHSDAEAFAAAFEFEETPDQLRTIQEVAADMEQEKPMDRLVCGDVGYGKTEVAMRAVFQAVMGGTQAAIIVPTTLLAQQHFQTFKERFAPFPVEVGLLSRFRTRAEQKVTLAGLKKGVVDIVIGTHRLFQKDIEFYDLGLIVVDEEHRFGVRHKERLKQMRKEVHVLTLTATPIPRTLQMAIAQVRSLSVIETAPADRLAIRTQLAPFDPTIIREAVFRELVRGGQVFFLHNRVHNIDQIGTFLAELLPEAKIGIVHGQMPEAMIEKVMMKFLAKETNVLLTTTIIESGIDIPSANTIIINHAERFGLSELYQLRGRVGRSGEQAYAYLLVQEGKVLTKEARQRLEAIQEFTELGSGFRVAARDLEIRGAGNLLGKEQSGQIASVGFELYLEMINDMVQELKGTVVEKKIVPKLHFRVSAYMPEDYIPDSFQRLSLYKRLSNCKDLEECQAIQEELEDRYGPLPDAVLHLVQIIQLKEMARALKISKLEEKGLALRFTFDAQANPPEDTLNQLLKKFPGRISFVSAYAFELKVQSNLWTDLYLDAALCFKAMQGES